MKNQKFKIIIFLAIVFCIFFIISWALAAEITSGVQFNPQIEIPGFKGGGVTASTLAWYIKAIYDWAIRAIILLAVVMMVVGGFQWVMAIGSAPIIGQAKSRIGHAFMGLILAVGTYFILNFVNPDLVKLKGLEIGEITGGELAIGADVFTIKEVFTAPGDYCDNRLKLSEITREANFDFKKKIEIPHEKDKGCIVTVLKLQDALKSKPEIVNNIQENAKQNLGLLEVKLTRELLNPLILAPFTTVGKVENETEVIVMTESDFISSKKNYFPFNGDYTLQVYFSGYEKGANQTRVNITGAETSTRCLKSDLTIDEQYDKDFGPKVDFEIISKGYKKATGYDLIITSFSDHNACWPEQCVGENWTDSSCVHTQYSCHYGGRWAGCQGVSFAVDISLSDSSGEIISKKALRDSIVAAGLNDLRCLHGGGHIHLSFGPLYDCDCDNNATKCSADNWATE